MIHAFLASRTERSNRSSKSADGTVATEALWLGKSNVINKDDLTPTGLLMEGKGVEKVQFSQTVKIAGDRKYHRCITSNEPYAAGLMFWFTQKKFVGSYFFLMAARRP